MSFGTAVYCFFQLVTRLKHGSGYRVIYIKIKRLYREKTAYIKTHETARGPHRRDATHILNKVSGFLLKSFHFRRLQRRQVFSPIQILTFRILRNKDAHISSLGYL